MPRKKSIRKAAKKFIDSADGIVAFLEAIASQLSEDQRTWIHDYAIIRLYREFESLVLESLVGAINNDTKTITSRTGIRFPKHLTDEVCEFLVIGDGYFDFKGRDGLIRTLKRFVPEGHYLVEVVKKPKYQQALERLSALRNFAAHTSTVSRQRARDAVGLKRLSSAGSWLKKQARLKKLADSLKDLARELETAAPY